MDIILIRHAQAQDRAPGLPDSARTLTEKGRHKTLAALPFLRDRIAPGQALHLYTSPAQRAWQTAHLVAEGLGHSTPLVALPGLYTGDFGPLLAALAALPQDSCALVVGHEPLLGELGFLLCGQALAFKKSGMAGLLRTGSQPLAAHLAWYHRAAVQ